ALGQPGECKESSSAAPELDFRVERSHSLTRTTIMVKKNANEIYSIGELVGHDLKNLINGADDHSDERLIQEDTVSTFIQ
ncbi:13850_t:CDS:2, partial [Racocetra persica]